jgi:hypothetical protein
MSNFGVLVTLLGSAGSKTLMPIRTMKVSASQTCVQYVEFAGANGRHFGIRCYEMRSEFAGRSDVRRKIALWSPENLSDKNLLS